MSGCRKYSTFYHSFSSTGSPTLMPNLFFLSFFPSCLLSSALSVSPSFLFFLLFYFLITVAILMNMYCCWVLFSFPCWVWVSSCVLICLLASWIDSSVKYRFKSRLKKKKKQFSCFPLQINRESSFILTSLSLAICIATSLAALEFAFPSFFWRCCVSWRLSSGRGAQGLLLVWRAGCSPWRLLWLRYPGTVPRVMGRLLTVVASHCGAQL